MFKNRRLTFKYFGVLLLWFIIGYIFCFFCNHIITKCTNIFNNEALFGASITIGALNGITSSLTIESLVTEKEHIYKKLILMLLIFYTIAIPCVFIFNINWLFSMFSLFSMIGFLYGNSNYETNRFG